MVLLMMWHSVRASYRHQGIFFAGKEDKDMTELIRARKAVLVLTGSFCQLILTSVLRKFDTAPIIPGRAGDAGHLSKWHLGALKAFSGLHHGDYLIMKENL